MSTFCERTLRRTGDVAIIAVSETFREKLTIALRHHQAGRLQAAGETIIGKFLPRNPMSPTHPSARRGCAPGGPAQAAVNYIQRAIRLNGNAAPFHSDLGEAYRGWGKLPKAVACFRRALELDPRYAEAHYSLGLA